MRHAKVRLGYEANPVDVPWHLDTGAANHMTDDRSVFANLNETITGVVCFGDNSIVDIHGQGTVMFNVEDDEHLALLDVYFIPCLKSNIIGQGQVDENGCPTSIDSSVMSVWDCNDQLLAKVPSSPNRL